MVKYSYLPVSKNVYSRRGQDIKYIIIHDTGNTGRGAGARAHRNYVGTNKRGASAHYFVDDKEICQFVGDSKAAGAVGDGRGRYGITNQNSLSIEMCINADGDYTKTYYHTLELTKNLMAKFNIPLDRVVRHYDASRKCCPCHMSKNNWAKWWQFKKDLQQPMRLKIDLSKDSIAIPLGGTPNPVPTPTDSDEYFEKSGLKIIKVPADRIYIQQLGGKTLRQVGAYGINGTFFDTKNPELSQSTWGIAINKGKPIGANAHVNHYKSHIKRATLIYGEGRLSVERINNINEIKRKVDWAIGGVGLYPSYDPSLEQVPSDILRSTYHTGIAFKGNMVYLIVSGKCTMGAFRDAIITLGVDGAIALDGGGSTQMYWQGNKGIHSTRKLNHIVGVKMG